MYTHEGEIFKVEKNIMGCEEDGLCALQRQTGNEALSSAF